MTYAELFAAVAERVGPKKSFCIRVETWCYADAGYGVRIETTWTVSVVDGPECVQYKAETLADAFAQIPTGASPEALLAEASDAIGDAAPSSEDEVTP